MIMLIDLMISDSFGRLNSSFFIDFAEKHERLFIRIHGSQIENDFQGFKILFKKWRYFVSIESLLNKKISNTDLIE